MHPPDTCLGGTGPKAVIFTVCPSSSKYKLALCLDTRRSRRSADSLLKVGASLLKNPIRTIPPKIRHGPRKPQPPRPREQLWCVGPSRPVIHSAQWSEVPRRRNTANTPRAYTVNVDAQCHVHVTHETKYTNTTHARQTMLCKNVPWCEGVGKRMPPHSARRCARGRV